MTMPYYEDAPWGADCNVSMPEPFDDEVHVDFGGLGFTPMGMQFPMTSMDREIIFSAPYRPKDDDG